MDKTGKSVLLPSVETKKVIPSDYRLFQVADFICTMKLTELKLEKHNMSVQELRFFGGEDGVRKNYLKDLKKYYLGKTFQWSFQSWIYSLS